MSLITGNEVINGGILRPAPVTARFDVHLIEPHLDDAMARFIIPLICEGFYNALVTEKAGTVSNYNSAVGPLQNAFPGNTAYEALWTTGGLMKLCALAALYEAAPFIVMQAAAGGIFTNDTEYGQSVGVSGVKFYQDTLMRKIELAGPRLVSYICDNEESLDGTCEDFCGGCDTGDKKPDKDLGIIFY